MMPAKFNLYSAWIDPYFYVWAAVFAAALFCLVFALRRWLELKGSAAPAEAAETDAAAEPEADEGNPFLEQPAGEKTLVISPGEQQEFLRQAAAEPAAPEIPQEEAPAAAEAPAQPEEAPHAETATAGPTVELHEENKRAENFVRGIYAGISDLDERMKGIEAALSKSHVNNDFAVTFLEDMLQDMDNLDKAKIKARLEYLVSDLKK